METNVSGRYLERLTALCEEGDRLVQRERGAQYIKDQQGLQSWLVNAEHTITIVFGEQSIQHRHWDFLTAQWVSTDSHVDRILGLLKGCKRDLEEGFLTGLEFRIAGEVLDSVLEQARTLNGAGFKDLAAILGRVAAEDGLRRLARIARLDDTAKASVINDALWKAEQYGQPQWRLIQHWLDIGNGAAHGKFDSYSTEDVKRTLEDIERFLASELKA